MTVFGVDLSLRSTGLASFDGETWDTATIKSTPADDSLGSFISRVDDIAARILNWCDPQQNDLFCIEGIAFSRSGSRVDHLHYAWWSIVRALVEHHGEPIVCTPTALKKLALGKGVGGKDEIILATARLIPESPVHNSDEADATWLAVAASIIDGRPAVKLPADRLTHLRKAIS